MELLILDSQADRWCTVETKVGLQYKTVGTVEAPYNKVPRDYQG